MSACPERMVEYMHEYLDDAISSAHEKELLEHLKMCRACEKHMNELKHVVYLLKKIPKVKVPLEFTNKVMSNLPTTHTRKVSWVRKHPIIVAAAIFAVLMSGALFSEAKNNEQFAVTNQQGLLVKEETVIVPENKTIKGDIVVKNGDIIIEGKVDGNVTVVNGRYMASTANVTGNVEEIDETFEWLWYTIKNKTKQLFNF